MMSNSPAAGGFIHDWVYWSNFWGIRNMVRKREQEKQGRGLLRSGVSMEDMCIPEK